MNQKKKPMVSVVIPTYKRASVLPEAIASVKAQEGAGELFDMEIVVVDDGSPDNTFEVMRNYPDIHYIRLETNHGQYGAVNIGIRASKGEYVALLDDDDLWLPHRLKAHLPVFESNPEVGVVYGQIKATGEGPEILWPDADRAPSGDAFQFSLMEELVLPMCVIIRRSAFEKAGYFDDKLRTMGHYEMFLRLSFHVPFAFVPGPIAIGRFSEDAKWFSNIKSGGFVKSTLFIVERALNEVADPERRTELRRQAMVSWLSHFIYWLDKADQLDQMRNRVLETLKMEPWMKTDPKAFPVMVVSVNQVAKKLSLASDSPIAAVRLFCDEVKTAAAPRTLQERQITKQLLSSIWMAAAFALKEENTPVLRRKAGNAALFALAHNPLMLKNTSVIVTLIRSILCQNFWGPFIDSSKKLINRKLKFI